MSVTMLGLVAGLDGIGYAVALASLMFTGRLAAGLEVATGSALLCTAIVAISIGLRSREATNIGQVQDVPVAVLATTFASADISVPTAFAIIAASSLTAGVLLWATGRFRLGRIVKYFPKPVLAGFLAGTGWLLLKGGVAAAVGFAPSLTELGDLGGSAVRRLIAAAALAVVLHVVLKRFSHPILLLAFLVASILAFYAWMAAAGTSMETAIAAGHIPRGSSGVALNLPFPGMLSDVVWGDVGRATPTILTTAVLCLFAMLMNSAALEAAIGRDLEVDTEMRTTGVANAMVAAVGGPPGYTGLSISILADKSGIRQRGTGVVSGAVVLLGFVFANQIITHIPIFLSAGFIMFLGIGLLADWLVESLRKYSITESITVLVILGFVVFSGFLQATIAGFIAASVLFTYSYARIPIVRSTSSLASITSTRERPPHETAFLREVGNSVEVIWLHGYLFFGSTERVVTHVRDRLDDATRQPLRALLIDVTLVPGLDAASASAFERLRSLGVKREVRVILCGATPAVLDVLRRCGVAVGPGSAPGIDATHEAIAVFNSIDPALHDIETWLLSSAPAAAEPTLRERVAGDVDNGLFAALVARMRRTSHDAGEVILHTGEPGDELLVVEHGSVAVLRRNASGTTDRLREMTAGAVVGDIGFSLGQRRSADIVATESTTVLRMRRDELDALEKIEPAQFALMHRIISRALAEKVITANLMTDQVKR
jgi:sulfate permease, SulP family